MAFVQSQRRLVTAVVTIAMVASGLVVTGGSSSRAAPAGDPEPGPPAQVERLAGDDRIATSIAIAERRLDGTEAFIARSDEFADSLSAGTFTTGPILLVEQCGQLRADTKRTLAAMDNLQTVHVLGGPVAVCAGVLDQLRQAVDAPVTRLAGDDRYATSVAISAAAWPDGAGVAYLTSGATWPDGVSGGSLSRGPVLLTDPSGLPASTADELQRLGVARVFVLGGPNAIGEGVVEELQASGLVVDRIAGDDRYATSVAIARHAFPDPDTADTAWIARGDLFPDALASGVLDSGPILLTPPCGPLPDVLYLELQRLLPQRIGILGGPAAVCESLEDLLRTAAVPEPVQFLDNVLLDVPARVIRLNRRANSIDLAVEGGWVPAVDQVLLLDDELDIDVRPFGVIVVGAEQIDGEVWRVRARDAVLDEILASGHLAFPIPFSSYEGVQAIINSRTSIDLPALNETFTHTVDGIDLIATVKGDGSLFAELSLRNRSFRAGLDGYLEAGITFSQESDDDELWEREWARDIGRDIPVLTIPFTGIGVVADPRFELEVEVNGSINGSIFAELRAEGRTAFGWADGGTTFEGPSLAPSAGFEARGSASIDIGAEFDFTLTAGGLGFSAADYVGASIEVGPRVRLEAEARVRSDGSGEAKLGASLGVTAELEGKFFGAAEGLEYEHEFSPFLELASYEWGGDAGDAGDEDDAGAGGGSDAGDGGPDAGGDDPDGGSSASGDAFTVDGTRDPIRPDAAMSVRAAPTHASTRLGLVYNGETVTGVCWARGDELDDGAGSSSDRWIKLSRGGYVNSIWLGRTTKNLTECGATPTPAPPAPDVPRERRILYDTFDEGAYGQQNCSGTTYDPGSGSGSPAGRFTQTFGIPDGVTTIDAVTVATGHHEGLDIAVYRGGTRIARVRMPVNDVDGQHRRFTFDETNVTPGEVLTLALENFDAWQSARGVNIYVVPDDVVPGVGYTVDNRCPWAAEPVGVFAPPAIRNGSTSNDWYGRIEGWTRR